MRSITFEEQSKMALNSQVDSLDSQTRHKLRNARKIALAKQQQPKFSLKWLTGAGAGLALASVLTFMIIPSLSSSNNLSPLDDLEMLTAEADLDLVTELEFYQWIGESSLSESTL